MKVPFVAVTAVMAALVQAIPATAAAATPPISSVACTAGITGCALAADGIFPPEGQQYQLQTAWWLGLTQSVVYTLVSPQLLTGLTVSLDNNDTYRIDVSMDGTSWTTLTQIAANLGEIGGGMDTFSTDPASPEFVPGIAFPATQASFLRIVATSGDNQYSVGELTLSAAVPEPSACLLMGIGLMAIARARRVLPRLQAPG